MIGALLNCMTANQSTNKIWLLFLNDERYRYIGHTLGNEFGAGTGTIGLDDVQCDGAESSIFACSHNAVYGVTDCTHNEDVSIACYYGNDGQFHKDESHTPFPL